MGADVMQIQMQVDAGEEAEKNPAAEDTSASAKADDTGQSRCRSL
jgi:hypothetical protein